MHLLTLLASVWLLSVCSWASQSPSLNSGEAPKFFLYNKKFLQGKQLNSEDVNLLKRSGISPNLPTKVLIHGWQGSHIDSFSITLRDVFLQRGNLNIIVVDWHELSKSNSYPVARLNVNVAGKEVARFLYKLVQHRIIKLEKMALIGHSLGAHVCGMAGKLLPNIPVIVGLDPAKPLFATNVPSQRLARGDARYVEIVHTFGAFAGFYDPIGDVDFYPNFGKNQPGCVGKGNEGCSHSRAYKYFAESVVTKRGFWAKGCRSFSDIKQGRCEFNGQQALMGGEPLKTNKPRGVYYLPTNSAYPFARGKF